MAPEGLLPSRKEDLIISGLLEALGRLGGKGRPRRELLGEVERRRWDWSQAPVQGRTSEPGSRNPKDDQHVPRATMAPQRLSRKYETPT